MNIIEKEIAKRNELIEKKGELLLEADQYRQLAAELEAKALAIDVDTLKAEVIELMTYLPTPVPVDTAI